MNTLYDHDINVPNDVSIIGFDDVMLAQFCRPKLTTMHYPIEIMATRAADLALAYAQGQQPITQDTFKYLPTIANRNSIARI